MDAKDLVNVLISQYCDEHPTLNDLQCEIWADALAQAAALAYGDTYADATTRVSDYIEAEMKARG